MYSSKMRLSPQEKKIWSGISSVWCTLKGHMTKQIFNRIKQKKTFPYKIWYFCDQNTFILLIYCINKSFMELWYVNLIIESYASIEHHLICIKGLSILFTLSKFSFAVNKITNFRYFVISQRLDSRTPSKSKEFVLIFVVQHSYVIANNILNHTSNCR